MFFPDLSYAERRQALLSIFGIDLDIICKRLKSDADFCASYCGFKWFLEDEVKWKVQPLQKVLTPIFDCAVIFAFSLPHF